MPGSRPGIKTFINILPRDGNVKHFCARAVPSPGKAGYIPASLLTVEAVRMVSHSPMPAAAVFFHQLALA